MMYPSKDIVNDQIHCSTPKQCSSNPGNASLFSPNDNFGASQIKSLSLLQESESLNRNLETEDIFQDLVEINDSTALLQDITSIDEFPKFQDEFVLHETRRGESSVSERNVDDVCQAKRQKEKKEGVAQKLIENKKHNQRPGRTRSAEIHNTYEKKRRDRIRRKVRDLQQLIPRCHKPDRASILDDAIQYLKALQHQVKLMSSMAGTTATYQLASSSISSSSGGIDTQSRQIPHFSPLLPRQTPMEIAPMCHPTGLHMAPQLPSHAYGYMINPFPSIGIMPPCGNLPQLAPISNNDIVLPTFATTGLAVSTDTTTSTALYST